MIINMSNGGSSGKVVTVNVMYGGKVGSEATVTCTNGKKTYIGTTNINGNAVFKLKQGSWTITAEKAYSSSSKTINVIDNCTVDISLFAATINITYPAGSTCTATDGTTTLTAPDTSGIWVCVVPNAGAWTVQCSYDGYMDTKTVSITSNEQDVSVTFISRYAPKVTYTGDYKIVNGDTENWTIRFLTSGTLTFQSTPPAIDVFCVGGGAGGQRNGDSGYGTRAPGGGGGYTTTQKNVSVEKDQSYAITIGAGGAGNSYVPSGYGNNGGTTTAFGVSASGGKAAYCASGAAPGGNGGSGGGKADEKSNGGSDGGNGTGSSSSQGRGQGTTTRAFGESGGELFAGGGAGFAYSSGGRGGAGGGGDAGKSGTVNTGGGGGGSTAPGNGGSGIVIIRAFKEG